MPIRLTDNIHLAEVDGDLVFLDARRNAYSCVARSAAGPVLSALSTPLQPASAPILDELVDAGLLAWERGYPWRPIARATPHADFHELGVPGLPVKVSTLLKLAAAGAAGLGRRWRPRPAAWLGRRRFDKKPVSVTRAATLALQFDRLRPLVPASGSCLSCSLVLLAFLRLHRVEADWVFGARTFPFGAHCWVELEGVVLNDVLEHVHWFTPIAVS